MKTRLTFLFGLLVCIAACDVGVNKTIYVDDGETHRGGINSVNGGIMVGRNCTLLGSGRTVNGRIEIGTGSRVEDLQSVNGSVDVDENVAINGDIETVNGNITCGAGTEIDGGIMSINGRVRFIRTRVDRNVKTVNGNVTLEDSSTVKGDVVIEGRRRGGRSDNAITIRIVNSVVEGDVIVEDADANVRVYLSEGGKVLGEITNAEVIEE
jgi:DUF4097 and DUF4098 domain-containing protein YvlB